MTVSPDFFETFNFNFLDGNRSTVFKDQSNVVITAEAASKLFPNADAMGKSVVQKGWNGKREYFTVTGIIENIPANTHFKGDVFFPKVDRQETLNFHGYSGTPQYVLLKANADVKKLGGKISKTFTKYNLSPEVGIQFLPVTDIHLHSAGINNPSANMSDIKYVYIFGCVAFLILVIGCINYVNLTTAQALGRVREVGIRKTLGGGKHQLAFQFIGESFLFFSIATVLAMVLSMIGWPVFSNFLLIKLPLNYLFNFKNLALFFGIGLTAGVLSGMYPAFFLSRMQPAGILKDRQGGLKINFSLRKMLIVFQFSISMVMVIATIVVWQQLDLFNNRPLGFDKNHLLILPAVDISKNKDAFKKTLLDNPNLESVSFVGMKLGENFGNSSSMPSPFDSTRRLDFAFISADLDFIKTMGIEMKQGWAFSRNFSTDVMAYDSLMEDFTKRGEHARAEALHYQKPIIITESVAKAIGIQNPVDSILKLGAVQGRVVGVAKNFQITSLKKVSPLLVYNPLTFFAISSTYIRVSSKNMPASIQHIEKSWKQFFPDEEFKYSFADENMQKMYESENRLASLFTVFALFAIGISALGLFSLVALIVRQRTKEIGIRKVMGASVSGIAILLTKDFVVLIIVSAVIASPIAWFGMNQWLQDFAHRVDIRWWTFGIAGLLVLLTGLITVSFQTIRAAKMNPVDSLKRE
ncbi:ABC transporter permease [Dyadobacter sp. CY347]|uniref:ABC transporter permease n=1 Tax=Dyadobacter sp. CY347 TaxID=2909336 RepID=UPI001F42692B|nr:ABC transporter permease [Dyadobacter sp. CY347]MCF2488011.1 FtsX-like permease family protein [Dyadobacter sp. CY347]